MPKTHELKTDPEPFQSVSDGKKTFEIRLNDRDFHEGDELVLKETKHTGLEMKNGEPLIYTGREESRVVSHILRGPVYGLCNGWVILSFEAEPTHSMPSLYEPMPPRGGGQFHCGPCGPMTYPTQNDSDETAFVEATSGEFSPDESPYEVPSFTPVSYGPKIEYFWWSWNPLYPYWSRSCWGGETIEEAKAALEKQGACGMDYYHNKLIRQGDGSLTEIEEIPCQRMDAWRKIKAREPSK